ncbi:kinesin-like protein KIF9 [Heliangelus exortis]|uniref:kinesin-like protein KIF9 n=1 Tax=Heliangelus exortis TaxID=472823 RepID=UPI003A9049ED
MDAAERQIQTFVRIKPTAEFAQELIKFGPDKKSIDICLKKDARRGVVNNQRTDWSFQVDGVLHHSSQELTYQTVAERLVSEALSGYSGTIMCYGQTGAGKTHTMTGATTDYEHRGLIPRALQQVFKANTQSLEPFLSIRVSYLEIYNETLSDLLCSPSSPGSSETQLAVVDCPQGVYVRGLSVHSVTHEEDALSLFFEGETNRVMGEHILNKNSSRSHCIFTIYLESHFRGFSDVGCIHSKINLIDLAGSERLSKTGSEGQVLKEASYINRSLSFLEQIIIALADPKRDHIPFRQSKLTHILKDSLGGNCNTVLVANVCGEAEHMEETLSSLRFAARMKQISTEPLIRDRHDQEETLKEILLKQELAMQGSLTNRSLVTYDPLSDTQIAEIKSQIHRYIQGEIDEIDIVNIKQVQEVFRQFKLLVKQQEHDLEARLRNQYVLIDINDFASLAALQQAGVVDVDGHLLEEEDGWDFGARTALSSTKHAERRKSRKSNDPRKEGMETFPFGRDITGPAPSENQGIISPKDLAGKEGARKDPANAEAELSRSAPGEDSQQPSSPPSKPRAFEQFKEESGRELNQIFKENKSILRARKKRSSAVEQKINLIKRELQDTKEALEALQQERMEHGLYVDERGQIITDQEEFFLTEKLKELQEEQRDGCAELQDLQAEIREQQQLVDQCRRTLISEFEVWYSESFLIPQDVQEALKPSGSIRPGMIPINRVMCLEEDDQERYRRMQEAALPHSPASVPFYRAKMKIDQKHSYTRTMLSLQQMQKKHGKKQPLSFLQVG